MDLPFKIDTKNLPTFLLTFSIAYIFLLTYVIFKFAQYVSSNDWNSGSLLVLISLVILVVIGFSGIFVAARTLRKREIMFDKLLEEQIANEIIDQKCKLAQIKSLEIENNLKMKKWNKDNPQDRIKR